MNFNNVIERLKIEIENREANDLPIVKDTDLSRLFNKKSTYIATCRHRETIPYESIVEFCLKEGYSLEYIFGGDKEVQSD